MVWADVLQACVMICGVTAIIVQGCINAGGFSEMLDLNRQHGRLTMFTSVVHLKNMYSWTTLLFSVQFVVSVLRKTVQTLYQNIEIIYC